jgi:hypothetical protein
MWALLLGILLACPLFMCSTPELPTFPQSSIGVFTESLGDYHPRSVRVSMVIMLPTPTLMPPEITDDDYYLSYCPRPPVQLVLAEVNDQSVTSSPQHLRLAVRNLGIISGKNDAAAAYLSKFTPLNSAKTACYSISPSGERHEVPKHRCIYCASFKETISAIVEDSKLF